MNIRKKRVSFLIAWAPPTQGRRRCVHCGSCCCGCGVGGHHFGCGDGGGDDDSCDAIDGVAVVYWSMIMMLLTPQWFHRFWQHWCSTTLSVGWWNRLILGQGLEATHQRRHLPAFGRDEREPSWHAAVGWDAGIGFGSWCATGRVLRRNGDWVGWLESIFVRGCCRWGLDGGHCKR